MNTLLNLKRKIIDWQQLDSWRQDARRRGVLVTVTNGCFDLLHVGHVQYLEAAKNLGGLLLVGLNSDESVRRLKGEHRPINNESDRAAVVAALESVDAVCVFNDLRATALLQMAQPDIWVKGGDYSLESLDPTERKVVADGGGKIVILPLTKDKSTTLTLKKIAP